MDNIQESPAVGVRRGRRGRRRLILIVAVLVMGGWFGRFAYSRITMRPTPRPEYWEAQLALIDPPGPGAMAWSEVEKILASCPKLVVPPPATQGRVGPGGYPLSVKPRTGSLAPSLLPPAMAEVLAGPWDESRRVIKGAGQVFESGAFKSGREALRKAVEAGWWDNNSSVIPGRASAAFGVFSDYREWARCLVAHSRWAREHDRDPQSAVDDWLITLRLARQERRSHSVTAECVAAALDCMLGQEMGLASLEGTALGDTAAVASQIDAIREGTISSDKMAAAERLRERCGMEYYFIREGGDWLVVSENRRAWSSPPGACVSRLWNITSPFFHDYRTACDNIDRDWSANASLKSMRECRIQEAKHGDRRMVLGPLDGVHDASMRSTGLWTGFLWRYAGATEVEAGVTMLALAEYKRQRGHYPDGLAELVPDYLPRLPIDYADLGVLRYRREGSGYVLYSIGPDGVDDGGRYSMADQPDGWDNPDLVYSKLARPKEQNP